MYHVIYVFCRNLKCNNNNGWYLYGSDWGCCGNYDGCCTWASSVCYYHDALCKCCDYGWLICGPDCKQDAECFETYEENTNKLFDKYPQLEENNIKKDSKAKIKQTADKSDKELIRKKPQLSNGRRNEVLQEDEDDVKMLKHGSKKYSNKNYIKPKILHFRKKFIKSINAISSDELFMADQPRVDSVDLGSGDGIN